MFSPRARNRIIRGPRREHSLRSDNEGSVMTVLVHRQGGGRESRRRNHPGSRRPIAGEGTRPGRAPPRISPERDPDLGHRGTRVHENGGFWRLVLWGPETSKETYSGLGRIRTGYLPSFT